MHIFSMITGVLCLAGGIICVCESASMLRADYGKDIAFREFVYDNIFILITIIFGLFSFSYGFLVLIS